MQFSASGESQSVLVRLPEQGTLHVANMSLEASRGPIKGAIVIRHFGLQYLIAEGWLRDFSGSTTGRMQTVHWDGDLPLAEDMELEFLGRHDGVEGSLEVQTMVVYSE